MLGIFIAILSWSSFAVEGHFTYQGQNDLLLTKRFETVYPAAPDHKARMQELLAEGYECQPKLQFVQCSKFIMETVTPPLVTNFKPDFQDVVFGELKSISTIAQGTDVLQYSADQQVTIDGVVYDSPIYTESANLVKVSVGDFNKGTGIGFVVGKDVISQVLTLNETQSQWVFKSHTISASFAKEP